MFLRMWEESRAHTHTGKTCELHIEGPQSDQDLNREPFSCEVTVLPLQNVYTLLTNSFTKVGLLLQRYREEELVGAWGLMWPIRETGRMLSLDPERLSLAEKT